MPVYRYTAMTKAGEQITETLSAASVDEAQAIIYDQGKVLVSSVLPAESGFAVFIASVEKRLGKVKLTELVLFSKQFRTMFSAGIPILRSLEILEQQTESKKLKKIILQMAEDVRGGAALSAAMAKHSNMFSSLYISMVNAGEVSGNLDEVFDRLVQVLVHEGKVKKDVKSALSYPVIVFSSLVVAFFSLVTFIIPQFASMFEKSKIDLPWQTQFCMTLHHLITTWWYIVGALLLGTFVVVYAWLRTAHGQYCKDWLLLHIPAIGVVIKKNLMARFTSIFAILQSSGVTVLQAIDILEEAVDNAVVSHELKIVKERLQQGSGLSAPLRQSKFFTPMVVNMISIGEETGQLGKMLNEITAHYDYEVAHAISRMTELLGPFLIACMAGMIGFFAMAVFLPMWEMNTVMGAQ
ncbi:type II secretion system F family protein [Halodesulfovibrio sp.]|jgi:type IV pilus assembly protein PilC|uniref:type II secretion system F family protein n=1 Tax=Halodesulfovibrio sp. TaxID=1912772 RepID=UPI0025F78160|nr:type II secretion system F family protein [Halodesulfovibrio sp.]MCT4627887.1 type II secretion system F family protein [Halodesulfovibrio sp.]